MIKRLNSSDFYQFVGQIKQTPENEHQLKQLTAENLSSCISGLEPNDIIIDTQRLTVAKEDNWSGIHFVNSIESKDVFTQTPGLLFPVENKSYYTRIYTRSKEKVIDVTDALDVYCKKYLQ